ncbi:MAG: TlpA family protein disulfide reductase [Actinomycetota bacterium]
MNRKKIWSRGRLGLLIAAIAVLVAVTVDLAVRKIGPVGYTGSPLSGSATASRVVAAPPDARAPMRALPFAEADGTPRQLAELRGRTLLVNLWATWCPPCVAEMPELDRLQSQLGGERFEVVAIALDRGGALVARRWLDKEGLTHLAVRTGETAKVGTELLPTSILVDAQGRVAWTGAGAIHWTAPDVVAEIEKVIGGK